MHYPCFLTVPLNISKYCRCLLCGGPVPVCYNRTLSGYSTQILHNKKRPDWILFSCHSAFTRYSAYLTVV